MSLDIVLICLTAILCCIILVGGIKSAAVYLSEAINTNNVIDMAKDIADKVEQLRKEERSNVDINRKGTHEN